jgi:hypothetical protein
MSYFFKTTTPQEPQVQVPPINLRTLQEKTLLFLIDHKTELKNHANNMVKLLLEECLKEASLGRDSLTFTYAGEKSETSEVVFIPSSKTTLPIGTSLAIGSSIVCPLGPHSYKNEFFNYIQKTLDENYGLVMTKLSPVVSMEESTSTPTSWTIQWKFTFICFSESKIVETNELENSEPVECTLNVSSTSDGKASFLTCSKKTITPIDPENKDATEKDSKKFILTKEGFDKISSLVQKLQSISIE